MDWVSRFWQVVPASIFLGIVALTWAITKLAIRSYAQQERAQTQKDIAEAERRVAEKLNGVGRRIDDVRSTADQLKGRIEGQDAALGRHTYKNEESGINLWKGAALEVLDRLEKKAEGGR